MHFSKMSHIIRIDLTTLKLLDSGRVIVLLYFYVIKAQYFPNRYTKMTGLCNKYLDPISHTQLNFIRIEGYYRGEMEPKMYIFYAWIHNLCCRLLYRKQQIIIICLILLQNQSSHWKMFCDSNVSSLNLFFVLKSYFSHKIYVKYASCQKKKVIQFKECLKRSTIELISICDKMSHADVKYIHHYHCSNFQTAGGRN